MELMKAIKIQAYLKFSAKGARLKKRSPANDIASDLKILNHII